MSIRRRDFIHGSLAAGGLAGIGNLSFLSRLRPVSAAELDVEPGVVQFRPEIEPLVRLLEETPREKLLEEVADRIGIVHMGKLVAVGTEEELHNLGGEGNAELEATFLALTREESDVAVQRQLHQG